jgi:hypothetical protein
LSDKKTKGEVFNENAGATNYYEEDTVCKIFDVINEETQFKNGETVNSNLIEDKVTIESCQEEPEWDFLDDEITIENSSEEMSTTNDIVAACVDCGEIIKVKIQTTTVQAELKKFFEQQESGLDQTFRCIRCRDCKQCLKGAGEERKSMMQEAHQEIIAGECVH